MSKDLNDKLDENSESRQKLLYLLLSEENFYISQNTLHEIMYLVDKAVETAGIKAKLDELKMLPHGEMTEGMEDYVSERIAKIKSTLKGGDCA